MGEAGTSSSESSDCHTLADALAVDVSAGLVGADGAALSADFDVVSALSDVDDVSDSVFASGLSALSAPLLLPPRLSVRYQPEPLNTTPTG